MLLHCAQRSALPARSSRASKIRRQWPTGQVLPLEEAGPILPLKSGASRFGSTKGQSSVEFAVVSTVFLLLLFAVMDYGWLMFAQMNVRQAVDDGGRYASTGQENGANTRVQSIISTVQNEISVAGVSASNLQICSALGGCYNPQNKSGTLGAAGAPGDTVTLTLTSTLPLMTPLIGQFFPTGGYTFTASATFKNEPFNPSNTD